MWHHIFSRSSIVSLGIACAGLCMTCSFPSFAATYKAGPSHRPTQHSVRPVTSVNNSTSANNLPVENIETRSTLERLVMARPLVYPGSSTATPVGYGVGWGVIYGGITGQTGTSFSGQPFGSYALGFGLGDPDKFVSLTSTVTSGGLDEVTRDGNLNFQLSRNLFPGTAIGIGAENVTPWGADKDNQMNSYIVGSTLFCLYSNGEYAFNMIATLGVGNSRFVHNFRTNENRDDVNKVRPFASLGFQVLPQAALVVDYVGLTYNAGISAVPFSSIPVVINVSAQDLTNRGGSHIPIVGSIGFAWAFA